MLIRNFKTIWNLDTRFIFSAVSFIYFRFLFKKTIFLHHYARIKGVENINSFHRLFIGTTYVGFMHGKDTTYLNLKGKLNIEGEYYIGRGCRIDISKNAIISIGRGGYINSNCKLIISNKLIIGNNCIISWNCQFLDSDFHKIEYSDKNETKNEIEICDNVWIGYNACINKGTKIASGCVVAANSNVRGVFNEKNCLIGGNPARIIKKNINWK